MNNNFLRKDEIALYDYIKVKNIIVDIFKLFKYLKRTDDKIILPRITMSLQVRYEQFIPVNSSMLENISIKNLMLETRLENKRRKLLSKITLALKKLNNLEKQVFRLIYYKNKSDEEIATIVNYGIDKVREIKKSACIKFVSALGLDYMCFK